jgi:hypothetical protein
MVIADEFSRWSLEDPDSTDPRVAERQIGPELWAWSVRLNGRLPILPFRDWREQRSRAA